MHNKTAHVIIPQRNMYFSGGNIPHSPTNGTLSMCLKDKEIEKHNTNVIIIVPRPAFNITLTETQR
jgi:hypothetical protein